MMKDELNGEVMKKFIGLRPKCYIYLQDNGKTGKRAKGVKRCVNIKFNDYKECLINNNKNKEISTRI